MSSRLTCPQGHQWELSPELQDPVAAPTCPFCGTLAETPRAEGQAKNLHDQGTLSPADVPPLVAHVDTLRAAVQKQSQRLSAPAPEQIGNYRILEPLGRGGMGVVYKARQLGLDRLVAIKMILAGKYADETALGRFRQEAESVARLQHPNIVQIYEIGEHEGHPFVALEYVAEGSLALRLDGTPLPPAIAARLVQTLSRAVAHAHRRGIVHRDLKPANILLAASDEEDTADVRRSPADLLARMIPKITDFGLAKRLDGSAGQTESGTVMGTPGYMAPEQAEGRIEKVGPRADVYALGAVFYELLTGRPPFVGENARVTLEQVIHLDPIPPSYLQPRVPRDLETICLKCLDKEPGRRYATADELADDIGRHLEGRPILARRTGPVVRLWKWAKRRPAVAGLIGVAMLALITFAVGSQWYNAKLRTQRDEAEEILRQAMIPIDGILAQVEEEPFVVDPVLDQKNRALLRGAIGPCQEFLKRRGSDVRLRRDTADVNRRLGDIERLQGNHRQAQEKYREAIRLFSLLRGQKPGEAEYRRLQAYCLNYLGESHRQASQPQEAEAAYLKAIELQRELAAEYPASRKYQQESARTYYNLGILYRETNRYDQAEEVLRKAMGLLETLVQSDRKNPEYRQELARVHINLGPLLRATQRVPAAIDAYQVAIGILQELVNDFEKRADFRYELAVAHSNRGNAYVVGGQFPEAKGEFETAQQMLSQLIAEYPHVPPFVQELANCKNSLAVVLVSTSDLPAAEAAWLDAAQRLRQLAERPDALPAYRADLGMTLGNLGWISLRNGALEKSRDYLREGIDVLRGALEANPKHPDYRLSLRGQYRDLAEALLQLGDYEAAAAAAADLGKESADYPGDQFTAACLLIRAGSAAEQDSKLGPRDRQQLARTHFARATKLFQQVAQSDFRDGKALAQAQESIDAALQRNGGLKDAFEVLRAKVADSTPLSGQ